MGRLSASAVGQGRLKLWQMGRVRVNMQSIHRGENKLAVHGGVLVMLPVYVDAERSL